MKRFYIFPTHLSNASALPCETGNTEITSLDLNIVYVIFVNKSNQIKLNLNLYSAVYRKRIKDTLKLSPHNLA